MLLYTLPLDIVVIIIIIIAIVLTTLQKTNVTPEQITMSELIYPYVLPLTLYYYYYYCVA